MPDCRYCEASFDDEAAYLDHLREEHEGDLGAIDRRRVEAGDDGGFEVDPAPLALGGVLVVAAAIVGYVVFVAGSGGGTATTGGSDGAAVDVARTPTDLGAVHYHGTMNVTIAGERIDFGRDRYQLADRAFHFEGGDGTRWHAHARGVTLEYAMATLGIGVTEDSVTVDGTTYRDSDPDTTVIVEVDGEPVDPSEYVLQRGDHVRIVVRVG